jgi:hypothetical protein
VLAIYTQHAGTWAKVTNLDELLLLGGNPLIRTTSFGVGFYFFYTPLYLLYWMMSAYLGISYEFLVNLLFRIPSLIGDIITTSALYEVGLIYSKSSRKASIVALAFFLNPYVIWISSIVGHSESLMMGFMLLSTVYLLKGGVGKSAGSLAFATSFRQLPLLMLPFYAYYVYKSRLRTGKFLAVYLLSTLALGIPYIISILQIYQASPALIRPFFDHWVGTGSAVQGTGSYGILEIKTFTYNFTGIIATLGLWPSLGELFGFRNFLLIYGVLAVLVMTRGHASVVWLNRCGLATYSLLLLFTPLIQHQYLMWVFPFLLIEVFTIGSLPTFVPYVLAFSSLLIDPITEGSFFYYTLSTFPFSATALQNAWPLRDVTIQLSISALFALTLLFTASLPLIRIFKGKRD